MTLLIINKKQVVFIRSGLSTNSSSSHTIIIANENEKMLSKSFYSGKVVEHVAKKKHFGWEPFLLTKSYQKALYMRAAFGHGNYKCFLKTKKEDKKLSRLINEVIEFMDSVIFENIDNLNMCGFEIEKENYKESIEKYTVDHQGLVWFDIIKKNLIKHKNLFYTFYKEIVQFIIYDENIWIIGGNDNMAVPSPWYKSVFDHENNKIEITHTDINNVTTNYYFDINTEEKKYYQLRERLYKEMYHKEINYNPSGQVLLDFFVSAYQIKKIEKIHEKRWFILAGFSRSNNAFFIDMN